VDVLPREWVEIDLFRYDAGSFHGAALKTGVEVRDIEARTVPRIPIESMPPRVRGCAAAQKPCEVRRLFPAARAQLRL
jgi:hypothetical protein